MQRPRRVTGARLSRRLRFFFRPGQPSSLGLHLRTQDQQHPNCNPPLLPPQTLAFVPQLKEISPRRRSHSVAGIREQGEHSGLGKCHPGRLRVRRPLLLRNRASTLRPSPRVPPLPPTRCSARSQHGSDPASSDFKSLLPDQLHPLRTRRQEQNPGQPLQREHLFSGNGDSRISNAVNCLRPCFASSRFQRAKECHRQSSSPVSRLGNRSLLRHNQSRSSPDLRSEADDNSRDVIVPSPTHYDTPPFLSSSTVPPFVVRR